MVYTFCEKGYSVEGVDAFYEMYPNPPHIKPITGLTEGQRVFVSVCAPGRDCTGQPAGQFQINVDDLASGTGGFTINSPCPSGSTCPQSTAEGLTEAVYGDNLPSADTFNFDGSEVIDSTGAGNGTFESDPGHWTLQPAYKVAANCNGANPDAFPGPYNSNGTFYIAVQNIC